MYEALLKESENKVLKTATFFVNEGNPRNTIELKNQYISSELHIGKQKFIVKVSEAKTLIDFITRKAIASENYADATEFDEKYKHKEFNILKNTFLYREIT